MALLKTGTRIFGNANVDNQLTVGSILVTNTTLSTSNTTGAIVLSGGIATKSSIYSGNIIITGLVNSNGITFTDGTRQTRSALEKGNALTQTVASSVIFSNNVPSTSNTTGTLIITGGVGVSGNIYVGGTNARANCVYTDVLRYAANGLPWIMGSGIGGPAFSRIIVSGQPDAIANIANSPLTLVGGTNITIETNGVSNTITINAPASNTTIASLSTAAAFSTYYIGLSQQSSGAWATAYVDTANLFYTTANGTLFVTNYNTSSDRNLKDDIITITDGLTTVDKLRGVSFKWKNSGEKSYGIIAQELEEILPDLVSNAGGHKSVNYNALIGFLIEAVKELSDRVDELEKK